MELVVLIVAIAALNSPCLADSEANLHVWEKFKIKHGREYSNLKEEMRRFHVFSENLAFIQQHNVEYEAGRSSYKLGVTPFADFTNEEYRQLIVASNNRTFLTFSNSAKLVGATDPPASFDWRDEGVPIRIRDQGQLGDASVIATTSALEAGFFISSQQSVSLSTQNLRDCVGFPSVLQELEFVKAHGISDEATYPSQPGTGPCQSLPAAAQLDDVLEVVDGDEVALRDGLLQNPAAVEIDASHISFQLYVSGVYDDPKCSASNIDHAVMLVGYGSAQGTEFWTLANSWGAAWGEGGYMKLRRGVNRCGVASYAGVPIGVHPA